MKINEKLKNLRKNYRMTLNELADKIGYAPNTIHNYESGKRQPDIVLLQQYATIFNVQVEEIIHEDINPLRVVEYWVNKERIDFLLENEQVGVTRDDHFILFFEPTSDGCIAWGRVKVTKDDGDVDVEILDLEFKDNQYKLYAERVVEQIWAFNLQDERASLIEGSVSKKDKDLWDFIGVEWQEVPWDETIEENRFYLYQ